MHNTKAQGFPATKRFQLERTLGAGGMGIVFEVIDVELHAHVALKTLRNLDPQSLYLLKREFRSLRDLHHPNLVSLGELIEAEGRWFFTMELVEGVDFLTYVRGANTTEGPVIDGSEGTLEAPRPAFTATVPRAEVPGPALSLGPRPFEELRLRAALVQLCQGLNALHTAGKIHRDIKPNNILVTPEGRVVLLDFGLVKESDPAQSVEESVVGTVAYMAPEQAVAGPVSPASDWYSVGVMIYEALTGREPFGGSALQVLMNKQVREPPSPHSLVEGVPTDLAELCSELMRFHPEQRPTSAEILARLGASEESAAGSAVSHPSSAHEQLFVGRTRELAELRAAFDATVEGNATAVYVSGESGIGKSSLIRRFARSLKSNVADLVVLTGRCHECESVPFNAIDGVVDSLSQYLRKLPTEQAAHLVPPSAGLLPLIFPVLARVESVAATPRPTRDLPDPIEQRNRVFAALRELMGRLADCYPTVLIIDDLQWADLDSLQLIGELLRPPTPPPLLLLATLRDVPDDIAQAIGKLPGDNHNIELDRLSPGESRQLATHLLARADVNSHDAARTIAQEAQGHPLFIDELVHHAQVTHPSDISDSPRLVQAIWQRVSQLAPEPVRLLELIALAGMPVPQEVIRQAAEVQPDDAGRMLSLLRVAHLVSAPGGPKSGTIEPYHHLIRESVLAHLDDGRRRHHHARLSLAIESCGMADDFPEIVVHHLEAAGRLTEAAARAEAAARVASRSLAFERAARLLRTAIRLGECAGTERHELQFLLGIALANAGRGRESAEAYLEASTDADPARRLECQRRAAEQFLICGHIEEGLTNLRRVLREVGVELPATPRKALFSLLLGRAALRLRGIRWKSRHESEVAAHDLTLVDIHQSVAHGLAMVDTIYGADFQTRGLRLALKSGETSRMSWALLLESGFLATQGIKAVPRARRMLAQMRARMVAEDPLMHALTTVADGVATYYEGRFRDAAVLLREGEHLLLEQTTGTTWARNSTRLFRLLAVRRLGEYHELRASLEAYLHDAARRGDRYTETSFRQLFNDVWLADDAPARAWAELDRATWLPPEGRFHIQHWYDLRARAEIAFYEGEGARSLERWADLFRAFDQSLLMRVQDARADYLWILARSCLLQSFDPAQKSSALKAAAKAARRLERERVGYTTAWAHLIRAGIAARLGDLPSTIERLSSAERASNESDLGLLAAAARRRRGELTLASRGVGGAEMIAQADRQLRDLGIRAPARMVAAVTAGFDGPAPEPV
jgi:eukaryotic-like serine/threonine-protein kinase